MITTFSVAACWAARGGIRGGEREFSWTQDESTSRVGKAVGLMAAALPVDDMSANADRLPGPAPEDRFEVARRGYDRRQVEEFVARTRREVADMRSRLARALREAEQLRVDLAAARRAAWETAGQGERAARELTALRTQAQMALARNLWWPPPQPDGE